MEILREDKLTNKYWLLLFKQKVIDSIPTIAIIHEPWCNTLYIHATYNIYFEINQSFSEVESIQKVKKAGENTK